MSVKLNDAVYRNACVASDVADLLRFRADALAALSMTPSLAQDLFDCADRIEAAAKDVQDAFGEKLNDDLRHSEALTGSLLKAVLVGALAPVDTVKA
jgi:hypothetical protein